MDANVMKAAMAQVLGEGYEPSGPIRESSISPSPRDALAAFAKSDSVGGDMHVMQPMGNQPPRQRKRGKLQAVSVSYVSKKINEDKLGAGLTAAGATGGVLSLPALVSHTAGKLKAIKTPATDVPKAKGVMRMLKDPKVGAGIAGGAAALELAGLGGDFVAHHALSNKPPKPTVSKSKNDAVEGAGLGTAGAAGVGGGVLQYRLGLHRHNLEDIADEAKKAGTLTRAQAFTSNRYTGMLPAETQVLRQMKKGRLVAAGAGAAGLGAAGVAHRDRVRKDNHTDRATGAALGAGTGLLAGERVLDHAVQGWRTQASDAIRESGKHIPGAGEEKSPGKPRLSDRQVREVAERPGVSRTAPKAGARARGAAAQYRHFVDVGEAAKTPARVGGLALLGTGGALMAMNRKVAKADHSQLLRSGSPDTDTWLISKADEDKRQVFGWCSISKKDGRDVLDLQGDYVPIEEIEKSAYDYMLTSRKGGNQHRRTPDDQAHHVGDVIESVVFTPEKIEKMGLPDSFPQGWWIGFKIHDDEAWDDIKSGRRTGFSIHGKGRREPVESGVSKATRRVDRAEQAKDIALGTAGATSAGLSAGSAGLPHFARKTQSVFPKLADAEKVGRTAEKMKTVGGVVGGVAGVYGGLHAVHLAAKQPPVRRIRRKVTQVDPVAKATQPWTPAVINPPLESKRMQRAQGYEAGATAGSAAAGAGAVGSLVRGQRTGARLERQAARVQFPIHPGKAPRDGDLRAWAAQRATDRGLHGAAHSAHANKLVRDEKGRFARAMSGYNTANVTAHADKASLLGRAGDVRRAGRVRAGKLTALGAGLGLAAGAIHHQRTQGSWKPYGA